MSLMFCLSLLDALILSLTNFINSSFFPFLGFLISRLLFGEITLLISSVFFRSKFTNISAGGVVAYHDSTDPNEDPMFAIELELPEDYFYFIQN